MICTAPQILFGWSNQERAGHVERNGWPERCIQGSDRETWQRERAHLEDLDVGGWIILKRTLKK